MKPSGKVLRSLLLAVLSYSTCATAREPTSEPGERQDWRQTSQSWIERAEQGDGRAQFYVSRLFADGLGVEPNAAESMRWLKFSARTGYAPAQYMLGDIYRTGGRLSQDPSQAIYWWNEAANAGFVQAQYALALLYFRGEGTIQDLDKALSWARRAAAAGSQEATELIEVITSTTEASAPATGPDSGRTITGTAPEIADGFQPGHDGQIPGGIVGPRAGTGERRYPNLAWIMEQKADRYTLQVFSTRSAESVARVIRMLDRNLSFGVYPFIRDDGRWFGVVVGSEAEARDAEAVRAHLPSVLSTTSPWVRTFGTIQAEIEKASANR